MHGAEQVRDRLVVAPRVLEPARPDLGVRPPVDATLGLVRPTQRPVVAQVAVVAEREAPGRVVERLRVGQVERRQLRRPAQVDEGRGRGHGPDARLALRVVAERPHVAVAARGAVARRPRPRPSRTRRSRTARGAR